MKKVFIICLTALCLSLFALSSCNVYTDKSKYEVKFYVGESLYETVTTDENGNMTFPENPTPEQHYKFDGWYLDKDTWESPFTSSSSVTDNITVYAKFSRIEYKVKFYVEGSLYTTVTVDENGAITFPSEPSLGAGYTFEGWYLEDTYQNEFSLESLVGITIEQDTEVYAKMQKHVLNTLNGTIETLEVGSKVWSTNNYVFKSLPQAFIGQPYILWSINGTNKITSIKEGYVYIITGEAVAFGNANSQMVTLDGYNFTLLDTAFWNIWDAALKNNYIYEKHVEVGEEFEFGRWSVVIMSETKLDIYKDEPIAKESELAVLKPSTGDSVANMALSAKVFSDRTAYTFYDMPYWLAGKNYILNAYASSSHSATVTKAGWVYMITSKAGNISIRSSLVNNGWIDVTETIPSDLNLFGDSTQNGAFLNSTYQGFALLKKSFNVGDSVSWGKWGIPVFSGEIVVSDNIAQLIPVADTTYKAKVDDGMRLFSDRTYYAMNGVPSGLKGLSYFIDGIETGASVKAVTSGIVYLMIPSGTTVYASLEEEVLADGWQLVPCRSFRLAVGLLFGNKLYYKQVEADEEIHYGKYNLIFGASLENEADYYVMPSLTTPADILLNPTGENYNTTTQNWLGCPTIELTNNGRIWAGWFTGGANELGTGNYAIIGYSDDGGVSWVKALAVVHPNTAVQVTKPELWTAPNGDLWLFWIQHTSTGNYDGKMGTWASVCSNSEEASPTWSTPCRLTDGYMRSKPIIVDVDGTETWIYSAFDWMEPHYARVYASVDKGATWSLRGKAECLDYSSGKNNLDDPVLVQKPDGTLWLLLRPSSGNTVYESFSYDGGYTWTHAKKSNIVGPQSRLTVNVLSDGKILLIFHDGTARSNLTAYLSDDGGKTWKYKLLIDSRNGVSYPDTVVLNDGTIYVIYDWNRTSDKKIYITVFTEEDIIAGDYVSENARRSFLVKFD